MANKTLLEQERLHAAHTFLDAVEETRCGVLKRLERRRRALMGQFFTPAPLALFMAGMFEVRQPVLRVLDAGAGIGSLSAAFVADMRRRTHRPQAISLTAYEIDSRLIGHLQATLELCRTASLEAGIQFEFRVIEEDFLEAGARSLAGDLFTPRIEEPFDCAILNPPYRKIRSQSRERKLLRAIGLETSNLYTGFLGVAMKLLAPGGEIVAITPRSFCNGPYFEPFRHFFLKDMRFRRVHVFDARDRAFADDEVLQENIIFRAVKISDRSDDVVVSSSRDPGDFALRSRTIKHDDLVRPGDQQLIIHIVPDGDGDAIRHQMRKLDSTLEDLGLAVSTGRVVDFRAKHLLRRQPGAETVPLIYPCHLQRGFVEWPGAGTRKPNALAPGPGAEDLLVPRGYYVLVKRFSAKEERRRVAAAVYDPLRVPSDSVAFENHLNFYHIQGSGLPASVARGLAAFLNSTLVDSYFRQFSGHTQVNAADLRALRYPAWERLVMLGERIGETFPDQEELDRLVEGVIYHG
ncbi:MAG: Eco57I restriction-modification methylase domain-containing protein [Calditrichaceae bacterium]|nr:Eco57I restriction-modification methylase domain-containing protein [Calditrichia bacterium]NUQ42493.1 Eco57I restriction-modification methylase domain-containing protein [Calditrichaceae bacterium]